MGAIASRITSLTIVYWSVYSDADQRKHQSSASPVAGEFPAQMSSNAENVSIYWRHHEKLQGHVIIIDTITPTVSYVIQSLFRVLTWTGV